MSFSIFFYYKEFDKDIIVLKRIFESWKYKPIHLIQESDEKTCKLIGMDDIVKYYWPGVVPGCYCNGKLEAVRCTNEQEGIGCKQVRAVSPITFNKWKGSYLCASSIKSKSYFELNKVKNTDSCPSKYKKCGIIDTLNNALCVPIEDNCPLNYFEFKNNGKNVRLETANTNNKGKIYTNFKVVEGNLCINHSQKEFSEYDYKLIRNSNYYKTCKTILSDDRQTYYNDTNFDKLDSYSKKHFYEQNNSTSIFSLPGYPKSYSSNVNLYGSTYLGWKKECMKKEFFTYMNNNTDTELNDIVKTNKEYDFYFIISGASLLGVFILGIIFLKYYMISAGQNKIDISNKAYFLITLIYIFIIVSSIFLYYIADINQEVVKNAKLSSDFFELIGNKNCSDDLTNALLKYLSNNFLSFPNRFFNIKLLSSANVTCSLFMIVFTYFTKSALDIKKSMKKKTFKFE